MTIWGPPRVVWPLSEIDDRTRVSDRLDVPWSREHGMNSC